MRGRRERVTGDDHASKNKFSGHCWVSGLNSAGMTWTPERKEWKDSFEVLSEHVAHLDSLLNLNLLAV